MLNLISSKLEVKFTSPRDLLEYPICGNPLLPYSLPIFLMHHYLNLSWSLICVFTFSPPFHHSCENLAPWEQVPCPPCSLLFPQHCLTRHLWLTLAEWTNEHPGCLTKVFLNTARANISEESVYHPAHCSVCDATPIWEIYSRMQHLGNLTSMKNLLCLFLSSY